MPGKTIARTEVAKAIVALSSRIRERARMNDRTALAAAEAFGMADREGTMERAVARSLAYETAADDVLALVDDLLREKKKGR